MRRIISATVALSLALFATANGSTAAPMLPTYLPAYEPRSVDERGMWLEADEAERTLRNSPQVIRNEALNSYVRKVLCNTVGEDRCKSARIYILEFPAFNASMMANGTLVIWSGLLLRVQNEGELASALGHEFAHFELRHSLLGFKQRRSATDVMAWAAVLGGLTNTSTTMLQLSALGSMFRFNREQEEAADKLGMQYLIRSPYPASSMATIWRRMMAEEDARQIGRKRKPHQRYSAGFFDTHPTELKRAIYLTDAAANANDPGDAGERGYRLELKPFMAQLLNAQIKLNDFGGSEYLLGQLASSIGWTGELLFARGELYRLRGNPRDLVSAAQFYSEAIVLGYAEPEVRRNLGLALVRNGQAKEGRAALRDYLRLAPQASDAKSITAILECQE